jgi:hypothetical protein
MTLISDMAAIDAEVLETLGEKFLVGGNRVTGIYQNSFSEQGAGDQSVEGFEVLFTCRRSDLPGTLEHRVTEFVSDPDLGDVNHGTFVFLRLEPDESGLTTVVLGSP